MSKKTIGGVTHGEAVRHGRKPVDIKLLKQYAEYWQAQLLLVRDGRTGTLVDQGKGQKTVVKVEILRASARVREMLSKLENLRKGRGMLWFSSPVFPEPRIWEQFKNAQSGLEMQDALRALERYIRKFWHPPNHEHLLPYRPRWSDTLSSNLLEAARHRADDLIKAKDLPHYPKSTKRKTSDDKRIDFFAKVLAGLALRLAPLGATKRLSNWHPGQHIVQPAPLRAKGPNCPHCGTEQVKGFPAQTIVRCPKCDERYYIASKTTKARLPE